MAREFQQRDYYEFASLLFEVAARLERLAKEVLKV
jgi:hypothetical protein